MRSPLHYADWLFARKGSSVQESPQTNTNEYTIVLSGAITLGAKLPDAKEAITNAAADKQTLRVVGSGISDWDSALAVYLLNIQKACAEKNVTLDTSTIPEGALALIALSLAVEERKGARRTETSSPLLERIGNASLSIWKEAVSMMSFLGEATLSLGRFMTGRARYRRSDLWVAIEQCGPKALGIVTTISLLVGTILAFVGSIQLKMFGAEVFVANLVGISMTMEMGALMTGIILAGRTGAAFAAELGTMQVNEEIDALQTMGIPPMDYLVMPRMIALAIMTPLLVIYADLIGIVGGSIVGVFSLNMSPQLYFSQTFSMLTLWTCMQGLIKGTTFGILIALAGCLRGMQCGRSASAVGDAATSAVVTSIVLIVVSDAIWTFIFMLTG